MPTKTAIITGASGFLGAMLQRRLREQGWEYLPLSSRDADLRDGRSLDKFSDRKFDRIFHLVAWTQAGDFCLHHLGEQWIINQQINTTVLAWWQQQQPQAKLVSVGTSCVYEEGRDLAEKNYLVGEPIGDLFTYAMTKRMLLLGQQSLAKQFGLKYLTVVPSTLYGPDYHVGEKQMHFIFDLAWKILDKKHFGKQVVLWGDGYQRRELIEVGEFVDTLLALDEMVENDVVNIGAGADHSIREFAGKICDIVGVSADDVEYDTARYVGARNKMLNIGKLDALLPGRKRTPLEAGMKNMLAWLEPRFLDIRRQQLA